MSCSAWGFLWGAPWGAAVGWGDKSSLEPDATILPIPAGCLDADKTARTRVWKQYTNEDAAVTWGDGIAALLGEAFAELEAAASLVAYEHYVATARGVHLEEIGAIVGRGRGPLTIDDQYRLAIIVDAATTYASGTPSEIIALATRLAAGLSVSGEVQYQEFYPAAYRIRIPDLTAEIFALVQDILGDTSPAGVGALLSTYDSDLSGGWSSTRAPLEGEYDDRVFWPAMLSGTDRVSSEAAAFTGTAYVPATDARDFEASSGDLITYASPSDLTGSPWSFSAWITLESTAATGYVLEIRGTGSTLAGAVAIATSGRVIFRHSHASTNLLVTSTTALSIGVPTHVACTYDGNSLAAGVEIWIDGVLDTPVSSTDGTGAAHLLDGAWTLGNRQSAGDGLDGVLTDVRAYARVLGQHEVEHVRQEALNDAGTFTGPELDAPVRDGGVWSSTYGAVPSDRAHWASAREIGA